MGCKEGVDDISSAFNMVGLACSSLLGLAGFSLRSLRFVALFGNFCGKSRESRGQIVGQLAGFYTAAFGSKIWVLGCRTSTKTDENALVYIRDCTRF